MQNTTIRKTINVDKPNRIPIVNFKQEDDAVLLLSLYRNSIELDLTGQTIKLGVKRANNSIVELTDGFLVDKNNIDITLKNNILAIPGIAECDLELIDSKGKMTTASFLIAVNKKVLGTNNIEASNDISAINKIVAEVLAKGKELDGNIKVVVEEANKKITAIDTALNKKLNEMQADYNSLQRIIIDENQAANLQDQINKSNEQLDNKANLHDSFFRYAMIRPITNIGDSISEGSNTLDYVNDSWCGLLNKAYQKKYNIRNQGFVNFNTNVVENNDSINTFHKINRIGFNTHQNCFEDSVFGGTRITSVNANEYVEINYTGKDFYVVYTQDENYGAIVEVEVDDNTIGQIDTKKLNGIKNGSISARVPVGEYGNHTIKLVNKGGTAQLCGIIYVEDSSNFSPVFYNVGRSSLALSDISDDILKYYASYGTVIFSLGVNDQLLSKDITTFKNKLDLMFSEINKNSGNCIINDFMFSLPQNNQYKVALKEYALKYSFEVIDYGSLMLQGVEPNKFIKYLDDDGVHPTVEGHEFIYNIISNKLGLPYTKSDLNKVLTINTPLLKNSWTNFVNDNSHRNACYYKKDNLVYLEGMIKGGISTSYTELFTLAPEFKPSNDIYFPVACSGEIGQITITKEGAVKIVSGNNSWLSLNGIAYYV